MLLAATPLTLLIPSERRTIRNLASSLCLAFQIPREDHHLVAILGLGGERCNQEAMENWVYCELVKQNLEAGQDTLATLINRLERLEIQWRYK
jgi:hypothetical protein